MLIAISSGTLLGLGAAGVHGCGGGNGDEPSEVCPDGDGMKVCYTRAEMVNKKDRLYELGGTLPDAHFKWDKKKAAEEHGHAH